VGLRLYDDLNERMTRAEATQIRDFVTAEVHQVMILFFKRQVYRKPTAVMFY
jgi:hypothetical protein